MHAVVGGDIGPEGGEEGRGAADGLGGEGALEVGGGVVDSFGGGGGRGIGLLRPGGADGGCDL